MHTQTTYHNTHIHTHSQHTHHRVTHAVACTGCAINNAGAIQVSTGARLEVAGDGGSFDQTHSAAELQVDGVLSVAGGLVRAMSGRVGGSGTVAGDLVVAGVLAPGGREQAGASWATPGTLSVDGDLSLESGTTLLVDVGSETVDAVAAAGDVTIADLATGLASRLEPGGTLSTGFDAAVLTAPGGALTGAFEDTSALTEDLVVVYDADAARLVYAPPCPDDCSARGSCERSVVESVCDCLGGFSGVGCSVSMFVVVGCCCL